MARKETARIAVYTLTRNRLDYTKRALASLEKHAGMKYDHYFWDNGSDDGTYDWLKEHDYNVIYSEDNKGQQIAANELLRRIKEVTPAYDYILRFDNDCFVMTKDILKRMVKCSKSLKDRAFISPRIVGLKFQPERFAEKTVGKLKLGFVEILGGICRLHPTKLLNNFHFDVRRPMGIGEAEQIAKFAASRKPVIPMVYIENVFVNHGESTEDQEAKNPDYFRNHVIYQCWPYVPRLGIVCE